MVRTPAILPKHSHVRGNLFWSFMWDYVINIGVGGTLCKELGVMDVAVADKVVQHDMNTTPLGDPVGLLSGINEVYLPTDETTVQMAGLCRKKEFTIMSKTVAILSVCQHTGAEDKDS